MCLPVSAYSKLLMLVIGMSLAENHVLWIFDGYLFEFITTVMSSDFFLLGMVFCLILVEAGQSAARSRNRCVCNCRQQAEGDVE